MSKIVIGETGDGKRVTLDAKSLIYSRALIQANSGGGKSGLMRVIAEQVAATIPTIIIDKEGEYHTLREKVDMVLVGEQGELAADVRSAGLLARKLVELGASAVIDLSGFTKAEPQQQFVKEFLQALIHLPRNLWHPTLIMLDEAHYFAPESGMGESVATEAVVNLMTVGRKRGFGGILATQRLSKLHKNAADVNNYFIGRTYLDLDQKRAARDLGMTPKDAVILRDCEKQHFYAFGADVEPSGVVHFRVNDCQTTIPKPGDRQTLKPPPASHVVLKIADKLKDIQQEAEVEIRTLNEAKAELSKAKRALKAAQANQSPRDQDTKRITELTAQLETAKKQTRTETKAVEKRIVVEGTVTRLEKASTNLDGISERLRESVDRVEIERAKVAVLLTEARDINAMNLTAPAPARQAIRVPLPRPAPAGATSMASSRPTAPPATSPAESNGQLTGIHLRVVNGLAELASFGVDQPTRNQLGFYLGNNFNSGYGSRAVGELKTWGLVAYSTPGVVALTSSGFDRARRFDTPTSLYDFHDRVREHLAGLHLVVFEYLLPLYPNGVHRKVMGEDLEKNFESGYGSRTVGELKTAGLVKYPASGQVAASELLFPASLDYK